MCVCVCFSDRAVSAVSTARSAAPYRDDEVDIVGQFRGKHSVEGEGDVLQQNTYVGLQRDFALLGSFAKL